ncbi:hypothetical protein D3C84_772340 [compost metagenome]
MPPQTLGMNDQRQVMPDVDAHRGTASGFLLRDTFEGDPLESLGLERLLECPDQTDQLRFARIDPHDRRRHDHRQLGVFRYVFNFRMKQRRAGIGIFKIDTGFAIFFVKNDHRGFRLHAGSQRQAAEKTTEAQ